VVELRLSHNEQVYRLRRELPGALILLGEDGEGAVCRVARTPDARVAVETGSGTGFAIAVRDGDDIWVRYCGRTYRLEALRGRTRTRERHPAGLASPMPGQVQKLLVSPGDEVAAHQPLLVVEAMKMQLEIKAPHAGRVAKLLAAEGEQVEAGVPLVEMEPAS
jgi:biotin carboxyl carrier protein